MIGECDPLMDKCCGNLLRVNIFLSDYLARKRPPFLDSETSAFLQEPTVISCSEPDESNPYCHILFLKIELNIRPILYILSFTPRFLWHFAISFSEKMLQLK
jgi:hypothetical protein